MKNKSNNYLLKITTILFVFFSLNSYAQYGLDWGKNYGGTDYDYAQDAIVTSDGGFLLVGTARSEDVDVTNTLPANVTECVWIVKLNSTGTIQWETSINHGGASASSAFPIDIIETADGGYIYGSTVNNGISTSSSAALGMSDIILTKLDVNGTIQWERLYGGTDFDIFKSILQLDNDNFIVFAQTESDDINVSSNYGLGDVWVLELTSTGNVVWEKTYGGSQQEWASNLIKIDDGYVFCGMVNSTDFDFANVPSVGGGGELYVMKIDLNGVFQWTHKYGGPGIDRVNKIIATQDQGFVFVGRATSSTGTFNANNGNDDAYIVKIDSSGNFEWVHNYGGIHDDEALDVVQKSNGNIVIGGDSETASTTSTVYGSTGALIVEIDHLGNKLVERRIGSLNWTDEFSTLLLDDMDNICLLITARSANGLVSNNYGQTDLWFAKLYDLLGSIHGSIVLDYDADCANTNVDLPMSNIVVQASNGTNQFYGLTDSLGDYSITVDTVDYEVTVALPSPYLDVNFCTNDTQIAYLNTQMLTDSLDFFIDPSTYCPYMEVDISAPLLRRCFSNNYHISYCNNGAITANNAYIEVEFDPTLVINSSTIPWTTVSGNVYTFPIANIDVFDCGSFSVNVSVPCDSTTFLGQILCTEAHIYPDSLCLPSTNTWNGAELEATVECIGEDSVQFTLKNVGTGNMGSDVPIIGIEDVILVMDTDNILNVGEEITWTFPTNGISTHRLIAQQPLDHPYKTFTTDAIAFCNLLASAGPPPVMDSAFLAYPNDEEANYIAIDCQAVIGSFDPNDKTASPLGVSANHYIGSVTDLEYKIRFQNTGTDTAFTVVIKDSISSLLDLTTFSPGASSHAYTYNLSGSGVVEFTFDNILLPDSFVDEAASHGFVQYKISQKTGNSAGDIIFNNADIFFDFNEPVRTNTTFNEIGGIYLDTIIYKFPGEEIPNGINEIGLNDIKIYPNPSKDLMHFEFEEAQKDVSIDLYDMSGKLQQKIISNQTKVITLHRGGLNSGMYLFKIYSGELEIAFGKLIFQ